MPDESPLDLDCAFCDREAIRRVLLHEGRDFYVVADHAPVADAHLLLIPREHYPHLAALPPDLDVEFEELKARVGDFVRDNHGLLTYWENGVFGQSVPHAHLHAISVSVEHALYVEHGFGFEGIEGMRRSHQELGGGHYFAVEHDGVARILPPLPDLYRRVLVRTRQRSGGIWRYDPMERRMHGLPLIDATMRRWFQQFSAK